MMMLFLYWFNSYYIYIMLNDFKDIFTAKESKYQMIW